MRIPGFEVTVKMWNDVTEQLEIHFDGVQNPRDRPPGIGDILGEGLSHVGAQIMKFNGVDTAVRKNPCAGKILPYRRQSRFRHQSFIIVRSSHDIDRWIEACNQLTR